jgi:hypothetical protein
MKAARKIAERSSRRRLRHRKVLAAAAMTTITALAAALSAAAPGRAETDSTSAAPPTYTGCLSSGGLVNGLIGRGSVLVDIGPGNFPPDPCRKGETQVSFSAGTLTRLVAGPGLTGGGNGGSVSLSVDPSQVQTRVIGSCAPTGQPTTNLPPLQAVQSINQDGSVTCTPVYTGTVTGVHAGPGLTGGGTDGDLTLGTDFNTVQRRVSGECASNGGAVSKINADGSVDCYTGPRVLDGVLGSTDDDKYFTGHEVFAPIAHFDLPDGNWNLTVAVNTDAAWNGPSDLLATPECRLDAGPLSSGSRGVSIPILPNNDSGATLTMSTPARGPVTVQVMCRDLAPEGALVPNTPVFWNNLHIVATQVGQISAVDVQPGG